MTVGSDPIRRMYRREGAFFRDQEIIDDEGHKLCRVTVTCEGITVHASDAERRFATHAACVEWERIRDARVQEQESHEHSE